MISNAARQEMRAAQIIDAARAQFLRVATVESCTGGLVAAALTQVAGASDVVEGGFVTYANTAKMAFVDVPEMLLARHGAVSAQVAIAMAEGGLRRSGVNRVIAVTGIAGPGGSNSLKPVGLVHFAVAGTGRITQERVAHFGDLGREKVRTAAVHFALDFLFESLN